MVFICIIERENTNIGSPLREELRFRITRWWCVAEDNSIVAGNDNSPSSFVSHYRRPNARPTNRLEGPISSFLIDLWHEAYRGTASLYQPHFESLSLSLHLPLSQSISLISSTTLRCTFCARLIKAAHITALLPLRRPLYTHNYGISYA